MKILRNILWGLVIFNVISVIVSCLPAGRVYSMPEFLMHILMWFKFYTIFALSIVNIVGAAVTLLLLIYGKIKNCAIGKNYMVLLILFLLGIPFGFLVFAAAMSV